MKKLLYIFLLFLVLPFACFTQTDTTITNVTNPIVVEKQQPTFKNQIDLDVQFLGVSLGYKHRLYNNWFVGGRIGGGFIFVPFYFRNNGLDIGIEFFHAYFTIQYFITNNIFVEFGTILPAFFAENPAILIAPEVGGYFTVKKIQIGIEFVGPYNFSNRIAGGYLYSGDIGYSISLLVVKIPLKKW